VSLPDDEYRVLLQARIAANYWDGTIPDAYAVWAIVFQNQPFQILIQDFGNMSMAFILEQVGPTAPSALLLALFAGGYFNLRPDGVLVSDLVTSSAYDTPVFAFDVENSSLAGFDVGAWAIPVNPATFPTGDYTFEVSDDGYYIVSDDGYYMVMV